jgi:hypothetical protein
MEKIIYLQYKSQIFPIKISYLLDEQGNVSYKTELLGTPISTFPYYQNFIAATEKDALELLGKTLVEALRKLLEV